MNTQKGLINRRNLLELTGAGAASLALSSATRGAVSGAPAVIRQEQTLNVAFGGTEVEDFDQAIADGFMALYPEATVNFIPVQSQDWPDYFSKVLTLIAAGTVPDVMDIATEGTQLFAAEGLTVPIDDYVMRDQDEMAEFFSDVHPSLIEAMLYQGSLYQLPFMWNSRNMYLNTSLIQEAGYSLPSDDWDKDTFYDMVRDITVQPGNPPFGFGWANRLMGGWLHWIYVNDSNLLEEGHWDGGEWLWDTFYKGDPVAQNRSGGWRWGPPQANNQANLEALEFVVQLEKEGLTPSVEVGGGDLLQGFFTSGNLGMTPGGGFWAGALHEAGMAPDAFDIQYWPKWKSQRHVIGTNGLVMMEASQNKDLAWEYMKYRVSKPVMANTLGSNTSNPARRSMMTAERYAEIGPDNWTVFYGTFENYPDTAPLPTPPWFQEMNTIFVKYTDLALSLSQTPQEALDNMQRDLEEAYANYEG